MRACVSRQHLRRRGTHLIVVHRVHDPETKQNYLGLKQFEEARSAFVKAIELSKDGAHVEAKVRLAATLMALGRGPEARKLAKEVKHLVGVDPAREWKRFIDVWGDLRFAAGGERE
ncbi:MAG: tetratricopeptide repeat protein [Sandaracinaceae bacterium]